MPLFRAFILGLTQGLTEFLPISSSGHLIIFSHLFGWGTGSLIFDTMLHLGTGLALVVYFWNDLIAVLKDLKGLSIKIILGVLPVIFIGFFFEDWFEMTFRSVEYVVLFLLLGSLLILIAEYSLRRRPADKINKELTLAKSFLIGLFQSFALFPGISRSGSTISGGLIFGLDRKEAARFSFLLSIPVILGTGLYQLAKIFSGYGGLDAATFFWKEALVGILTSFAAGLFCIQFLMKFLTKNTLLPFVFYRIALAVFLMASFQ